jgi:hypothetical protein
MLVVLTGWVFPPSTAASAKPITSSVELSNQVIERLNDNLLSTSIQEHAGTVPVPKRQTKQASGQHSTRAEGAISAEQLKIFLLDRGSPLSPYAGQILLSPYWSTIIGICWIEQYGCTRAPGNNYWGIGPGIHYPTIPEGIAAIDTLLTKYEAKGKDTIEELNGYYVQPASANWFNTVVKIKNELESL